ncbi:MAG TPA: Wadjet anti-phage system protein JetD domain-containing protein [Dongiaceae bacterium]|nr:Wadjet anti-phage system protein JetD domain-containing protein [Dongiaceae bacterium]
MAVRRGSGLSVLNYLLDAVDAAPDRVRMPSVALDHGAMNSAERNEARVLLGRAADLGAIEIKYEKGDFSKNRPDKIRLKDPDLLANFLGRTRSASAASNAAGQVREALVGIPDMLLPSLEDMEKAWSRAKPWRRIEPNDVSTAVQVLRLAWRLLERDPSEIIDERTFSSRTVGDTKELGRREDAILGILVTAGAAPFGVSMGHFGVVAFPDHIQVRGPVSLATPSGMMNLEAFDPSAAIPPEQVELTELMRRPPYLLTIENKTSFQRYVRLIRDGSLVVFTSGFVSEPCAAFLKRIVAADIPWFHWGDIDPGGLTIFNWLEINIAGDRRILPHLMTREIALAHGTEPVKSDSRLSGIVKSNSVVADLAAWLLNDPEARVLEQEILDPVAPMHVKDDSLAK